MLNTVLAVIQIILAIVLVLIILIQQKGAGLGAGFGGGGGPIVTTRRGVDLFLHRVTIAISLLFFLVSAIVVFV